MPNLLTGFHVVSLVGRQGAGKSFLGGKLAALLHCGHIEVSDVVRSLNKGMTREQLPETWKKTVSEPDWLGKKVAERIFEERRRVGGNAISVLTGAREVEVHKYLLREGAQHRVVEIYCNPYTRCERLIRAKKVADEMEFLGHEVRETQMGIVSVLEQRYARVHTSDTSDPDDLMKKLMTSLKNKGVRT